jgi:hypothetical protein
VIYFLTIKGKFPCHFDLSFLVPKIRKTATKKQKKLLGRSLSTFFLEKCIYPKNLYAYLWDSQVVCSAFSVWKVFKKST